MNKIEIKKILDDRAGNWTVFEDVSMDKYTSFRAGGSADIFIEPDDIQALKDVLLILKEHEYPHMILGNGTNILVKDGGYRGAVIKIGKAFGNVNIDGETMTCGTGCLLSSAAKAAAENSLEGFEFASGIPGSVGGAVFMNAGAYGGEISDMLQNVRRVSNDGRKDFRMDTEMMDMGYRHSVLHDTGDIAVEAVFRLRKGNKEEIYDKMTELNARRTAKQPVNYQSSGSFFKRQAGYFAGKLIQDEGIKGLSVGGAQVSELHSGFIINRGGAAASDIIQLMEIVQSRVFDEFGVKLEPEVRIIGE